MLRHLVAGCFAVLALSGCSQRDDVEISHVHGVAYDAGRVFLATHHGLARGDPTNGGFSWHYVGDPYDYMGFTQDAEQPGTFYSSGHPHDPRAFGAVHLGLRRSTDGGATWEQRALKGEVDFHALTSLHGAVGALVGSWQGSLKVSRDGGATWTDRPAPLAPVVALGSSQGRLLAATTQGLWEARDLEGFSDWAPLPGPGGMVSSIASSRDGLNLLAGTGDGRTGSAYRSTDGGLTWTTLGHDALVQAPGQVHFVFDRDDPAHAFAALGGGSLYESRDGGETWTQVR